MSSDIVVLPATDAEALK
jgi:hypothetical protein